MSFLQQADKFQTAQQIKSWVTQATSSMQTAQDCVVRLKAQRIAMTTNPDFTPEDIQDVDTEIGKLLTLANELING